MAVFRCPATWQGGPAPAGGPLSLSISRSCDELQSPELTASTMTRCTRQQRLVHCVVQPHLCLVLEHVHHSKWQLSPHGGDPRGPALPAPAPTNLLSIPTGLLLLEVSSKWNHAIGRRLSRASSAEHHVFKSPV